MNDSLEITTLGQLDIRRNGRTVAKFPTRKVEALLVYLACTGRAHPREYLAELLWPDRSQEQSLTNLRSTLSRLNEQLAPFLLITRKAVSLHPQAEIRVDAIELYTALHTYKSPLSPSSASHLEHALTLYTSDFLNGFSLNECQGFEQWQFSERDQLRHGVMEALNLLTTFHLGRASFDAGILHATRLLSLDPLREETHRQMMQLLAGLGQRRAALAQYDRCRHILSEELGIEPETFTTTLSQQIHSGTFVPPTAPPQLMHNLPAQPTRFIGREAELRQIEASLSDPDCHLLTLVGPGGIGKTRLAYQVAEGYASAFANGVCIIPLASISSADYLLSLMLERLSIHLYSSTDQKTQLLAFLREKHLLLLIDNCEHVLDGIGLLAEIIATAPAVKILATSRERLNLQGEWLCPVQGLSFPRNDTQVQAENSHALQLFVQSARRVNPAFHLHDIPAVVRICALVEGLPLAIELAASWVLHIPCDHIATHIQHNLDLLSTNLRDVPERHRSIRALFEHSWRLLSGAQQSVLRKLSVFCGGFDADLAAQIAGASLSTLYTLTEKSLVRSTPWGRYDLHELLRQFAQEKLHAADEEPTTRDQHLAIFLTWAREANLHLRGQEQVKWFQRIETEQDNLRAALAWGINGQEAESGLHLANALWWFWFRRGYRREGSQWFKAGLQRTEGETPVRAYALYYAWTLMERLPTTPEETFLEDVLHIGQRLGLHSLVAMASVSLSFGIADDARANDLLEQAIALLRRVESRFELPAALFLSADRARARGDLHRAEALYRESLALAQADQNRELMISPLGNLGRLAASGGDYPQAVTLLRQAVAIGRELGNPVEITDWLVYLATVERYQGDDATAEKHLEETLALLREWGNTTGMAHVYHCLADLALHRDQPAHATALLYESLSLSQRVSASASDRECTVPRLLIVSQLAMRDLNFPAAAQLLGATEALREQNGSLLDPLPRMAFTEAVIQVRKQLEQSAFEAAWTQGSTLTASEAVTLALSYVQARLAV